MEFTKNQLWGAEKEENTINARFLAPFTHWVNGDTFNEKVKTW